MDNIFLFRTLNSDYTKHLQSLFQPYSCSAGETIIHQGKPADYLYFIVDGKAEISFKPYDGIPITISHVEKNGLFGWSALIGNGTYSSSVRAMEDLQTIRIHGSDLRKLCLEQPEIGQEILERLASNVSARWNNSYEQVKSLLTSAISV